MTKLDETSFSSRKMDDSLGELEDNGPELSVDSGDQKIQATKESKSNIEDLDMVSKENEHPMDLIVVPLLEKPIGSLENK